MSDYKDFKQLLADLSTEKGLNSFLENNKKELDEKGLIPLFKSNLLNLTSELDCVFIDIEKYDESYAFLVGSEKNPNKSSPEFIIADEGVRHCYWFEEYETFREAVIAFFEGCEEVNVLLAEGSKYMSKTKELMSEYMEYQNISADNRASNLDNVIEKANAEKNKTIVKVCTIPEINKSR